MVTLFDRAHERARTLLTQNLVERIWQRDPTVWVRSDAPDFETARASIGNRLGWLTTPADMRRHIPAVDSLTHAARAEQTERVYLLGMGGSSLCAEVLRSIGASPAGFPDLQVLDTTDPRTIANAAGRMRPERTLFIVASKSGSTVEVTALERFFAERTFRSAAGSRSVAITDPGTSLEKLAVRESYRAIFRNPPDIGGRFSALSLFGLVPGALAGVDITKLLDAGETMAEGCRQNNLTNAGLALGALMALAAQAGRDKLTLLLPPSLSPLGLWIEQLVAESTGKRNTGLLPVVDEPIGHPDAYGDDRLFVAISSDHDAIDEDALAALSAVHPVMRLTMRRSSLGAEFYRWEFAVAVAGAELHINPFDEPNVQEAKDRTRQLLDRYQKGEEFDPPAGSRDGAVSVRSAQPTRGTPHEIIRALLASAKAGDYVAFLSYLSPDESLHTALQEVRAAIRDRTKLATTVGTGPRYLHSTGQYHKGGPNRGIAIILTGEESHDLEIPGTPYSFGVLKRAQAVGDFEALVAHDRRVIRIHLTDPHTEPAGLIRSLFRDVLAGL